jgi:drug/metabolite transporter (DMT)-like permease
MLLANTSPLMVPFLMLIIFRQKLNHKLWAGLILDFIGVILVLHPDGAVFNWYSLLALLSALSIAMTLIIVRKMTGKDHTNTISFFFLFYGTIMLFFISIPQWHLLTVHMLLPIVLVGVLAFFTQYTLTLALRVSKPELVSTLFYSNLIFAAIISAVFFNSLLGLLTVSGMVLIILGGAWVIRMQNKPDVIASNQ